MSATCANRAYAYSARADPNPRCVLRRDPKPRFMLTRDAERSEDELMRDHPPPVSKQTSLSEAVPADSSFVANIYIGGETLGFDVDLVL